MAHQCKECEGPTTACPTCHRFHCDDPECGGMPVSCAEAVDEPYVPDEEDRLFARDYEAWADL